MFVDSALLKKLEKSSSISVNNEKKTLQELNSIISFIDSFQNSYKEPLSSSSCIKPTPFREDDPQSNSEIIENILNQTKNSENGFFIVPKIIE